MAKARLTKMAKLLLYAKQRGYVGVIQLDVDLDGIEVYWLESKEFAFFDGLPDFLLAEGREVRYATEEECEFILTNLLGVDF
ncbi:MAG: hypothetical protein E7344_00535 [Clostridiales bacterium]|nr:hypothetical protein [Clostridiales bacterium]